MLAGMSRLVVLALVLVACDDAPQLFDLQYGPNAARVGEQATISGRCSWAYKPSKLSYGLFDVTFEGRTSGAEAAPITNLEESTPGYGLLDFTTTGTFDQVGAYTIRTWVVALDERASNKLELAVEVR